MVSISKTNAKKVYSAFNRVQSRASKSEIVSLGKTGYVYIDKSDDIDGIIITIKINGIFIDIDDAHFIGIDENKGLRISSMNSYVRIPYRM